MPLGFEENLGYVDKDVRFMSQDAGYTPLNRMMATH